MKLISHRGNLTGPSAADENLFEYVCHAVAEGFDVEVDVWVEGPEIFFGHDGPITLISKHQLDSIAPYAWFHSKNPEAFEFLTVRGYHTFWHNSDNYTITSRGYVWAFPGYPVFSNAVAVMPELVPGFELSKKAFGICSDYVGDMFGNILENCVDGNCYVVKGRNNLLT